MPKPIEVVADVVQLADQFAPGAGTVLFFVIRKLAEKYWMNEDDAEELQEHLENGDTKAAAEHIEQSDHTEEIVEGLEQVTTIFREEESFDEVDRDTVLYECENGVRDVIARYRGSLP